MACCGAKRGGGRGCEAEKCDDCRSWEEELYWKRFHPLHFCQILHPGTEFQKQLGIPRKFARNVKALLPPNVTLRGPSGASWCVIMKKKGDDLFLSDGWEEFVKAYTLKENSVLIFKYDGNSVFDVLIFDGQNLCEKESAYFVKKCGHADPFSERQRKRASSEANIEENDDNPIRKPTKQAKKDVVEKTVEESPKLNNSQSNGKTGRKKVSARSKMSSKPKPRERTPVHSPENLCDSFAMLAELGKTIVQNATSYMEPENTTDINGSCATKSPNQDNAPEINGSFSPKLPSQGAPQSNGSSLTDGNKASDRGKRAGIKKSLNEAALQKAASAKSKNTKAVGSPASAKSKNTKTVGSPGKPKSSKNKVASTVGPRESQPSATGAVDVIPFGSTDSSKKSFVSESGKLAMEMARKQMTDKSFLLVLRPTNVYKRFMVTVPPNWFKKHLPPNSQEVFLRMEDKTWVTKLGYSPVKGTGQICGGWKQFVRDNHLEEFDVCLFSLVSQKENTTMLDVSIYRAGPTMATPISQVMTDATIIIPRDPVTSDATIITPLNQVVMDDTPMLIIE